jgi:hypothetical protein
VYLHCANLQTKHSFWDSDAIQIFLLSNCFVIDYCWLYVYYSILEMYFRYFDPVHQ